ncbi:MAG: DUF805 domain-containing protein [Robiginitomaculum sp.]
MNLKEAVRSVVLENYANFNGRASRSEYWWYTLAILIVEIIFFALIEMTPVFAILGIALLGLFIPGIAVMIRRMHDLGKSGWFCLLGFIPIVSLLVLYWYCLRGTVGPNQYGDDPLNNIGQIFD